MPSCINRYQPSSNKYIQPYIPKWCPPEPNTDPKRFELYCKPTLCRSEPLSNSEYLRLRAKNGGAALSTGVQTQVGQGQYLRTIWTSASNNCQTNVPLPAVHPGGHAADCGFITEATGAKAGRGTVSWYDKVNRMASINTLKKKGYAIAAETCSNCVTPGTISYVTPGCPNSIKNLTNLS